MSPEFCKIQKFWSPPRKKDEKNTLYKLYVDGKLWNDQNIYLLDEGATFKKKVVFFAERSAKARPTPPWP